ncbi:unnamed protein product [Phytomonas sp. Hart1]|nr:unnamed protein product [Phytomonas sp. Hart1]|eukprot:CCW69756.1 unnamed protein product [Phytomonas sp. isolate Hart1]
MLPAKNVVKSVNTGRNLVSPLRSTSLSFHGCVSPHNEETAGREAETTSILDHLHRCDVKLPIKPEEDVGPTSLDGPKLHNSDKEATNHCTPAEQGEGGTDTKVITVREDMWHSILQRLNALEAVAYEQKVCANGWVNPKDPSGPTIVEHPPETKNKNLENRDNITQLVNGDSCIMKSDSFLNTSARSLRSRSSVSLLNETKSPVDSLSRDGETGKSDDTEYERVRIPHIGRSPSLRQSFCKGMTLSSVSLTLTQEIAKVMLEMRKIKAQTKTLHRGLRDEVRKRRHLERDTSENIHHLSKLVRYFEHSRCFSNVSHSAVEGASGNEGKGKNRMITDFLDTDEILATDSSVLPALNESRITLKDFLLSQYSPSNGTVPLLSGSKPEEHNSEHGGNDQVGSGLVAHPCPTAPFLSMSSSYGLRSRTSMHSFPDKLEDGNAPRNETSQSKADCLRGPPPVGDSRNAFHRLISEDPPSPGPHPTLPDGVFPSLPILLDGAMRSPRKDPSSPTAATLCSDLSSRGLPRVEPGTMARGGRRNPVIEVPPSVLKEDSMGVSWFDHSAPLGSEGGQGLTSGAQTSEGDLDSGWRLRKGRGASGTRRAPLRVSPPLPSESRNQGGAKSKKGKSGHYPTTGISKGNARSVYGMSVSPPQGPTSWPRLRSTDPLGSLSSSKLKVSTESAPASNFNPLSITSNLNCGPLEGSELMSGICHHEVLALQSSLDSLDGITSHVKRRLPAFISPDDHNTRKCMGNARSGEDCDFTAHINSKDELKGRKAVIPSALVPNQALPMPQFTSILGHPSSGNPNTEDIKNSFLDASTDNIVIFPNSLVKLSRDGKPNEATKFKNRSTPSFPSSIRITQLPSSKTGEI